MKYERKTPRDLVKVVNLNDSENLKDLVIYAYALHDLEDRIEHSTLLTAIMVNKVPTVGQAMWIWHNGKAEKVFVDTVTVSVDNENMAIKFGLIGVYKYYDCTAADIGHVVFYGKAECEEFERNKPF